MPWKETGAVEQRLEFIREVLRGDLDKAQLCRRYGISRPTGDKWLERFVEHGMDGLNDLPSSPHHHPNQVADELAEMLLALRREHMTWGPKKLKAYLARKYPTMKWPWPSTIGELLKHHGLAVGRTWRRRTPPYTRPFAGCGQPNTTWCADFKGQFHTGNARVCYPLTITDAFSRYLLRCQGMPRPSTSPVQSIFESAFREYGMPLAIRSDNGSPFASNAIGGLSRLSMWWLKLGIVPERIEPGHPEQNGRHERMHLTLKKETASPPRPSLRSQQQRFNEFREEYNTQRPHEALDQRTPAETYQASPRGYPSRLAEPEYGDNAVVRYVRHSGEIKWQGRRMYLGQVLSGENVGLEPVSDGYWLVYFYKMALGVLDDRRRKVWNLEVAKRNGWVTADVLPSLFRCAPETGQNVEV
jgi:transposase InsO family protein